MAAKFEIIFLYSFNYNRDDAEEFQAAMRLEKYFSKEAKKLGLNTLESDSHEKTTSTKKSRRARSPDSEADSGEENKPLAKRSRRTFWIDQPFLCENDEQYFLDKIFREVHDTY